MPSDTDANQLARPDSAEQAAEKGQAQASHEPGQTTRTSAFSGRSCRLCGQPITGRRTRFCSDSCRMRAGRGERQARLRTLVTNAEQALAALKEELLGRAGTER